MSSNSVSARGRSSTVGRWTGVAGILLSGILLWWVLHDVDFSEVGRRVANARILPFGLCIVVATLTFPLKTIRWRYLLRLEGAPLPFVPLWHATAIGFMANNILPARAGEFARAYAAQKLTGARFSTAFASIALERVLDGITLVACLMLASFAGGFGAGATIGGASVGSMATWGGVVFGALLVASLLVVRWPRPFLALTRRALALVLPHRWVDRVTGIVEGLVGGLDALRAPGRALAAAAWSVVIWGLNAAAFWLMLVALDIQTPWTAPLMLQSVIAFGIALPSAPGFVGLFEGAARATLLLYGVPRDPAVAFALTYHVSTFFPITFLGLWSLWRANLRLTELRGG